MKMEILIVMMTIPMIVLRITWIMAKILVTDPLAEVEDQYLKALVKN